MLLILMLSFSIINVHHCLYFTTIPSAFQYPGEKGALVDSSAVFDEHLITVSKKVVSEHYNSKYVCDLQPISIRCLIGREETYIFPYECRVQSADHKKSDLTAIYMPMYEPISGLFLTIPFVYDRTVVSDPEDPEVVSHSNAANATSEVESCPCNCRVDCRPPISRMTQLTGTTICADCRCLMADIECQCLDQYDLEFAKNEDNLRQFLEYHPKRMPKEDENNETLVENETTSVTPQPINVND